tara:strand:+ start:161 stop:382 length:222 start_codon:yes stop_codon:yes gene_type:complete
MTLLRCRKAMPIAISCEICRQSGTVRQKSGLWMSSCTEHLSLSITTMTPHSMRQIPKSWQMHLEGEITALRGT